VDIPERARLTVGELAARTGLTTRAVRHYDRIGLLRPDSVDVRTGYRRYHPDQEARARLVRLLRSIDVPIAEVRDCLSDEPEIAQHALDEALRRQQTRLQARVTRLQRDLHEIHHLLTEREEPAVDASADDDAGGAGVRVASGDESGLDHRALAVRLFNATWELLERENRTRDDDDRMLHMAHASRFHWGEVGTAAQRARGEWQVSRVYCVLRRPEPALHHATRVVQVCLEHGIGDWDLGFGYEAIARAHAVAGNAGEARRATEQALAAARQIADDVDRDLLMGDLETIPGQPRFW
jgi:DNA-binding transcriptional MerR regulator